MSVQASGSVILFGASSVEAEAAAPAPGEGGPARRRHARPAGIGSPGLLKRLLKYRSGIWGQLVQFGLVGFSGMGVDLAAFLLLLSCLPLAGARATAILLAMLWNFWWNRRFTFSAARKESPWRQLLLFCGASSLGAVISWSTCVSLCSLAAFFAAHKGLAAFAGIVLGSGCNFALSRSVVFRTRKTFIAVPAAATPAPGLGG